MPFRTAKSKNYQYDITVAGHRFRGSCGTSNLTTAKAIEARVRIDAQAQVAAGSDFTMSEILGTYFRDVAQHKRSAKNTASQTRSLLRDLGPKTRLSQVTDAHIAGFVARKRATVSNATVNRQLELLGRALRYMAKVYKAEPPKIDLVAHRTKEKKERIRELSQAEQGALFDHLPPELHAPVQFALLTGCRISTMTGLQWSDVDFSRDEMNFALKGDRNMTFPITAELRALLLRQPKSRLPAHRSFVFTRTDKQRNERVKMNTSNGMLDKEFRAARDAAEIQNFRFHDLRHTFATRMLRQTQNIKLVSRLLGHSSIKITERYAHVLLDDMRSALDSFSPLSGGRPSPTLRDVTQTQTQTNGLKH